VARKKTGRDLHGIFLLNKSSGLSSNSALQKVRRLFNANKAGHTGALDPLAEGMLPICLGELTKISGYLLEADKTYLAKIKLGETTTTGDMEGEVLDVLPVADFSQAQIEEVLARFRGEILQTPPMFSALKHEGRPLYEYARKGIHIDRPARPVTIYALSLVEWQTPFLTVRVACSKGTYIRTLAEDIGAALHTGGHLVYLLRESVAGFESQQMMRLESLEALASEDFAQMDATLISGDVALAHWPVFKLNTKETQKVLQGQQIAAQGFGDTPFVRIHAVNGVLIGIGEVRQDTLCIISLFNLDLELDFA
jgi:tRNA pseudouridine55 synthase